MPDALPIRAAMTADTDDGFTVADLCRRWKVGADKVHAFRRAGELVGVNLATNMSIRPLWRFTPQAVGEFEKRRSSTSPPKPARRRRQPAIVDYFPD